MILPFVGDTCRNLCQYIQLAVPGDNKVNSEHVVGKDRGLDEAGQQQLEGN